MLHHLPVAHACRCEHFIASLIRGCLQSSSLLVDDLHAHTWRDSESWLLQAHQEIWLTHVRLHRVLLNAKIVIPSWKLVALRLWIITTARSSAAWLLVFLDWSQDRILQTVVLIILSVGHCIVYISHLVNVDLESLFVGHHLILWPPCFHRVLDDWLPKLSRLHPHAALVPRSDHLCLSRHLCNATIKFNLV